MEEYVEIEKEETDLEEVIHNPFNPADIKLTTNPMNLGDLIDRLSYDWINFYTDYQRGQDLWSDIQQSRLIESAMLGLRLPAFYFEEITKKKWNIIDGLQRCCAIKNFCVDKSFRLHNLEFLSDFEGKSYDELPFEITRDIRMLPITTHVLDAGTPSAVKYILFKRLNTGGIPLNPQEIRNAIYQGTAMTLVKKLASLSQFQSATQNKIPTKRMEDLDFVSRFLAFYLQDYHSYQPDLNYFVNAAMTQIQDAGEKFDTESIVGDFTEAMNLSVEIFGPDAFRKRTNANDARKPLNKAYFEVISSTFAKMSNEERNALRLNKKRFIDNCILCMQLIPTYDRAFSGGTAKIDSVECRHSYFREIVNYSINNQQILMTNDNKLKTYEI